MDNTACVRIDMDAVYALIRWKAQFVKEVATAARCLAAESERPTHVTLADYRHAAIAAIQSLSATVRNGGPSSDDQTA